MLLRREPEPSWPIMSACGIPAEKVEKGVDFMESTTLPSKSRANPLVSVIIPNKDHSVDLDLCIRSIIERAYL